MIYLNITLDNQYLIIADIDGAKHICIGNIISDKWSKTNFNCTNRELARWIIKGMKLAFPELANE